MEVNSCKSKYQKFKLRVKLWEKDFKRKHNRVPSKYDIREAPQEVKDSYKMYYKLKTTLLEDTLNDVLSDDGFDIMEMSIAEPGLEANVSQNSAYFEGSHLPTSITSLLTNDFCTSQGITESRKENIRIPNIAKTDEDPNEATKVFHSVEEFPLNNQAWCNEKKKSPEVERKKKELNLKHKLFQSSSFSKRNPRKSLIRNKLQNSNQNTSIEKICNGNTNEILPDLQTILLEKAKEQQTNKDVAINTDTKENKDALKIHVDKQWLQRTSQRNGVIIESMNESVTEESSCSDIKYGLTNINITKLSEPSNTTTNQESTKDLLPSNEENNLCESRQKNNYESEADSIINDSEDDDQASYRHIVKRRRLTENTCSTIISVPSTTASIGNKKILEKKDEIEENNNTTRKVVSKKSHKTSKKSQKSAIKMVKSDPKTGVRKKGNSNCNKAQAHKKKRKGAERKSKRIQSPTNEKRCDQAAGNNVYEEDQQQPPAIEDLHTILSLERVELTCLPRLNKLDDLNNLAQKYIEQTCNPSNTRSTPSLSIKDEKISTARRKLEDKIAAGKLNENFVTINIQKKKFVRGKKSINYSRYKKKLWKNKKRIAALSGPDMDMGGCDGGTLKCFTCGQAGHFAQNCKVKGDQLLPLTAQLEDDPSPFPTLKEAELMARQATLTAHNGNIFKMPQAGNMALLNKEQLEDDEKETSISHQIINGNNQNENESEGEGDGEGHMENQNNIYYQNSLLHENDEEILAFDVEKAIRTHDECANFTKKYVGHKIPEDFLKAAGFATTSNHSFMKYKTVQPLYELNPNDTSEPEVTTEVIDALHMFGHTTFRKGQDRAIMRILTGLSTLVTLSTGSGKSLCYQLPAYLYARRKGCITLVISPLVSLMEDQVTGVPHFLRAHCLHTNQTPQQKLKVMDLITKGEVDILLVSPEGVVAGERSTGFGSILRKLPPIAFACIDEAHCVSQWSHNFRPSYLMICKILQQNLGVKCILGLTATATLPTRLSIIKHLGIEDGDRGIISDVPLPDNLILSVSKDENRDNALLELLMGERFAACHSIIIYCTRRDECERVAGFLRTTLHDHRPDEESSEGNKRKRKRTHWHVEPYHAGLAASRRRTVQNAFMKNELRIVVATVAFGMGINKPDIRAVVHYNMPRNFESYVQEVGRAGRDNRISHCHLLLDANGNDKYELRRHIYANSIDRHVIRKLLQRIFVPCACSRNNNADNTENSNSRSCGGHEIGFSIEETVQALDIPAENIATLLCYMELDNRWCINVLSNAYIKAKVISYGGPKYLKHAAKECPPLATAIALHIKNGSFQADNSIVEFSVIDIAAAIGWNSGVVKYQLKNLEWIHVNGQWKRSPITVTFFDLGFRLKVPGDFTTEEIDEALDTLYNRSLMQEHTQLKQLQYIYQGLSSVTYNTYKLCSNGNFATDRSEQLKAIIRDYFQNDCPRDVMFEIEFSSIKDEDVINDINSLINMYPDNNFSGRTVARIFHGISSPNYPAVMWHRCKYWRIYSKIDFNRIIQLANNVLVCRR